MGWKRQACQLVNLPTPHPGLAAGPPPTEPFGVRGRWLGSALASRHRAQGPGGGRKQVPGQGLHQLAESGATGVVGLNGECHTPTRPPPGAPSVGGPHSLLPNLSHLPGCRPGALRQIWAQGHRYTQPDLSIMTGDRGGSKVQGGKSHGGLPRGRRGRLVARDKERERARGRGRAKAGQVARAKCQVKAAGKSLAMGRGKVGTTPHQPAQSSLPQVTRGIHYRPTTSAVALAGMRSHS